MGIAIGMMLLYAIGILAAIALIIYIIAKRIDDKQREDFEKRDH